MDEKEERQQAIKKNVRCPKCTKSVPIEILKVKGGKCSHCGYLIADHLSRFF
jgi:ribosomal protein S27AE